MKCAICLRGAMSKIGNKFIYPGTLYSNSPYVNYNAVYVSIMKHIVNANPNVQFDFLIQSWNIDLKNELTALYNPVATSFEDNNIYKEEIINNLHSTNISLQNFGSNSQLLAFTKSLQLLKNYVDTNNVYYDYVILYRPDVLLWKNINLYDYDKNKIYVNAMSNGGGDFHFVMNMENSFEFGKIYETTKYNNIVTNTYIHGKIKMYVEHFMKKELFLDDIVPGRDQEVLRKLKIMIRNTNVDVEKFYEYGLTYEEIETYIVE
jgi:hypothetical protein